MPLDSLTRPVRMDRLTQDLRYAVRTLVRNPGFALVAVLTLALGIGANTAIFSVVNGVLLKPLDYRSPGELVFIHSQFPNIGFDKFWISPPEYRDIQQNMRTLTAVGAWRTGSSSLSGIDTPVRVISAVASAELFRTLGVDAQIGRTFDENEDITAAPVALISDRLWQNAFGGDPSIVGERVELNGSPTTVLGVMPAGFDVEDARVDVWTPLGVPLNPTNRGSHFLNLAGRLAPGATVEQARGEMEGLLRRWSDIAPDTHVPDDSLHRVVVKPLADEVTGDIRPALVALLGAVGFVLLIACANVANLLLARAETRRQEISVRMALGAGHTRMVRQFLTESILLAVVGGGLGILLGYGGLRILLAASPGSIPRSASISLDGSVLLFTFAIALFTGLLFGLAPLLNLSAKRVGTSIREGGARTAGNAAGKRMRRVLVIAEVALAVVLVVGSGLLLRSFTALRSVDPGFQPSGLLTFQLSLPASTFPDAVAVEGFEQRLLARLEGLPGVSNAAMMSGLPPLRDVNANDQEFEGRQQAADGPVFNVDYYQVVNGDYFETMEIPIVSGRGFRPGDDAAATPVAVINESFARVFYPGENPIGQRTRPCCGDDFPWLTIVGIARDVKQGGLSETTGTEIYFSAPQAAAGGFVSRTMNVVVRTTGAPLDLADDARQAVWSENPALPLSGVQTMEDSLSGSMVRPRFFTLLLGIFALLALTLAAIGTYGVLSYAVAERRREIGIRMALGAESGKVMGMVLRDGVGIAVAGIALGIVGALMLTRLLESMLFGISAIDATTFLIAPAVLAAVSILACVLPARRAVLTDPILALRAD